jgi:hypothetical protein
MVNAIYCFSNHVHVLQTCSIYASFEYCYGMLNTEWLCAVCSTALLESEPGLMLRDKEVC